LERRVWWLRHFLQRWCERQVGSDQEEMQPGQPRSESMVAYPDITRIWDYFRFGR
jgi:hypothetical protein